MAHLLIIGGSDAGISAALRARELSPSVDVTIVLADAFPNYSICGLPFYVSGEVPDWRRLAHRTQEEIEREGIRLLLEHTARGIDPVQKTVQVETTEGQIQTISYDRLVIATGAAPTRPQVTGLDLPGVHLLHTMEDSFRVQQQVTETNPQTACIVGAGYIGLEMADALRHRGLQVTLVVRSEVLRTTIDASPARLVEDELRRHGIELAKGIEVESIEADGSRLRISGSNGFRKGADLVLVVAGVRPCSELAARAGVSTGAQGAICVNREMETDIPDIYAAGDCVETWHHVTQKYTYLPLGTTAHKQGRIAGENALGGHRQFAGSLGTQVVKVFDLAVARTGLREDESRNAGFDPVTSESKIWDHKAYYPTARQLLIRVMGDRRSGRLLGAQIVGHWQAEVAKRIDIFAAALFHEMKVEELNNLDLSYTPPVSSPWDPVQMSAQDWVRQQVRTND
jgi:NADPH-dependent 2,4-dienoyl-CoA reductase/sulfur reductase-like enzyme